MMLRLTIVAVIFGALTSGSSLAEEVKPLQEKGVISDLFELVSESQTGVSLDLQGEGADRGVEFSGAKTGWIVALFAPGGQLWRRPIENLAVSFKLEGKSSFGVYARIEDGDAKGYFVLVTRVGADQGMIRLYKKPIWVRDGDSYDKGVLALKQFDWPGEWCRLRVSFAGASDGAVEVHAELLNGNQSVVEIAKRDLSEPITTAGTVGLRFYSSGKGKVAVKDLVITAR